MRLFDLLLGLRSIQSPNAFTQTPVHNAIRKSHR